MTTGEYLSSISTVSNVSALEHFLNIETGGGGGTIINIIGYTVEYESPVYIAVAPEEELEVIVVDTSVTAIYEPKEAVIEVGIEPTVIVKEC